MWFVIVQEKSADDWPLSSCLSLSKPDGNLHSVPFSKHYPPSPMRAKSDLLCHQIISTLETLIMVFPIIRSSTFHIITALWVRMETKSQFQSLAFSRTGLPVEQWCTYCVQHNACYGFSKCIVYQPGHSAAHAPQFQKMCFQMCHDMTWPHAPHDLTYIQNVFRQNIFGMPHLSKSWAEMICRLTQYRQIYNNWQIDEPQIFL